MRVFSLAFALVAAPCAGQVVITEVMAANRDVLSDRDGLSSDWIELHNLGSKTESLAGHSLTDSIEKPQRWRFPAVQIGPGGFLVVYLSGKSRADLERPLHTNFRARGSGDQVLLVAPDAKSVLSEVTFGPQPPNVSQGFEQVFEAKVLLEVDAVGRYLVPDEDGHTIPTAVGYDDSAWPSGRGGFGFDVKATPTLSGSIRTDVGSAMRGRSSSIYYRIAFDVSDPDAFDQCALRIRFETGFVAFLNGVEIARRRAPKRIGADSEADAGFEPRDPHRFEFFEIRNAGSRLRTGKNVLTVQGLVESANSLEHLIVAEIVGYRADPPRLGALVYLDEPTPGRPNGTGLPAIAGRPSIRPGGALFQGRTVVRIDAPSDGSETRYTIDGSEPDANSLLYTSPFELTVTAQVKARCFRTAARPSATTTAVFTKIDLALSSFSSSLPLVVISTFGQPIQPKVNVDAHAHFIETAGARTTILDPPHYSGPAKIKTRGSSSLDRPKKAYGLGLFDTSGDPTDAKLCGLPADTKWVLYGPHNWDQSHLRNALCYELARSIGLDAPRTRFVELFVNHGRRELRHSDYVGLYLLVERISRGRHRVKVERLKSSHLREPKITGGYILKIDRPGPGDMGFKSGDQRLQFVYPKERAITDPQRAWLQQHFDRFEGVLSGTNFADPVDGYAAWLDVPNWIDYHFFGEYSKNPDAYTLSTYLYKRRGHRVRMGPVWDCDRTLRTNDEKFWVGRPSNPTGWTSDCYYSWWGMLFRDPKWRQRYRARGLELLNGKLSVERVHALIRKIAGEIAEAEERDRLRWPIIEPGEWHNELLDLEEWVEQRTEWFQGELLEAPEFTPSSTKFEFPFTVAIEHANQTGTLYYTTDGADPRLRDDKPSPRARVYESPINVAEDIRIRARVKVGEAWSRMTDRWYVRKVAKLAVTELMYNPRGGRKYEYVELFNYGDETVDLRHVSISGVATFHFALGSTTSLAPGEYVVVVHDLKRFSDRYDITRIRIAGEFMGRMSNTKGKLVVHGSVGEELCRIAYNDDWYEETDAGGYSLVAVKPVPKATSKRRWRASDTRDGDPGR